MTSYNRPDLLNKFHHITHHKVKTEGGTDIFKNIRHAKREQTYYLLAANLGGAIGRVAEHFSKQPRDTVLLSRSGRQKWRSIKIFLRNTFSTETAGKD